LKMNGSSIMDEAEIKQLLAADDPAALAQIYDFAGQELYGYLIGLTGSRHDGEELLHDLFIRIVDKQEKLAVTGNLKAYLFRMAANLAYDRLRCKRKQALCLEDYAVIQETDDTVVSSEEDQRKLNMALAALPPDQREAVIMRFFMGKTFGEIASVRGVSENTVISRCRYALQKLKTFMEARNE